ncbi:MAG: S24 family peptidase [Synechococcaceae cyanobacterium SM2_3_2]|nr:S24 family peptidase [Synechococcaceae cyanobacterium SM2_3_2]
MAPTLDSGDMVIVDESAKFADRMVEGIFVLRIDGYLRVKRLKRLKERIWVLSDNPAYRPKIYRLNQLQEEFAVLGGWPV